LPGSGGTVTFAYDPFGRRIQKTSPAAGTTNYLYDGPNVVVDLVNGAFFADYLEGPGIDEFLVTFAVSDTDYVFFAADELGSITSLSGSSANVTDTYSYKPFGITTPAGTTYNRYRYTGREWDQETGLYYYRARYYDPQIGRFVRQDPARFAAGVNFYAYVTNRPTFLY
jgi:RHS repeat-associated protein